MVTINNLVRNNKLLFNLASTVKFLYDTTFSKINGGGHKYPKVIQLPITYKCNSRCIMCNIWQMDHSDEMNLVEFAGFLKDPIFKQVESVGINGGEPSLIPNLNEFVKEILKLPKLKSINVISHGFNSKLILKSIEGIYTECRARNIKLHISISLDGIGLIHDNVRGVSNVFNKTLSTIQSISNDKQRFCDSFDIACTVVRQNIDYLMELDVFAQSHNFPIKYRLAINNKRIQSERSNNIYSVTTEEYRQQAIEFFHYQLSKAKTIRDKFKYYSIFYWLNSSKPKRLLGCIWKEEGITMDSRGDLYYCAVESNKIGSLRSNNGESIFFNVDNIDYRKNIISNKCDDCIHDYPGKPEIWNVLPFIGFILRNRFAMLLYKYKCRFGII